MLGLLNTKKDMLGLVVAELHSNVDAHNEQDFRVLCLTTMRTGTAGAWWSTAAAPPSWSPTSRQADEDGDEEDHRAVVGMLEDSRRTIRQVPDELTVRRTGSQES
jgi:hypothetical protein